VGAVAGLVREEHPDAQVRVLGQLARHVVVVGDADRAAAGADGADDLVVVGEDLRVVGHPALDHLGRGVGPSCAIIDATSDWV
jgi:hypothetical protein